MLTTFYFDHEIFEDESLKVMPITNQYILDSWYEYGCLGICKKNQRDLIQAVKQVHSDYRQKWIAALTMPNFKKVAIDVKESKLSVIADLKEFQNQYHCETVTTGLITTDYIELYSQRSISSDEFIIEIITPCNFNESKNFASSKESSTNDINQTDSFDNIWDSRFKELAKHTDSITILDRYLALNILNDLEDGLNTSLERFVEKLSSLEKSFSIDIFSACDVPGKNVNATTIKNYIDNILKKKPYYSSAKFEIKFSLCKNLKFSTEAHERMLCFDNHVIQIGNGMDIFREKDIVKNTFTIKSKKLTFFDESYRELSRNREWQYKP